MKVRGVQVHGARHAEVVAGQRAALNLAGVDVDDVQRGQTLHVPGTLEQSRLADAVLDVLPDATPIKHGARVRFHQGTAEILGRVAIVGPPPAAGVVRPGSRAYVRLRLERPAVLVRGDRFIIRAYSPPRTIAGGHRPRSAAAAAIRHPHRGRPSSAGVDSTSTPTRAMVWSRQSCGRLK